MAEKLTAFCSCSGPDLWYDGIADGNDRRGSSKEHIEKDVQKLVKKSEAKKEKTQKKQLKKLFQYVEKKLRLCKGDRL